MQQQWFPVGNIFVLLSATKLAIIWCEKLKLIILLTFSNRRQKVLVAWSTLKAFFTKTLLSSYPCSIIDYSLLTFIKSVSVWYVVVLKPAMVLWNSCKDGIL